MRQARIENNLFIYNLFIHLLQCLLQDGNGEPPHGVPVPDSMRIHHPQGATPPSRGHYLRHPPIPAPNLLCAGKHAAADQPLGKILQSLLND